MTQTDTPHCAAGKKLTEIAKQPGVVDLPMKQRGAFAQALRAEAEGKHDEAAELLEKACNAAD